MWVAFVVYNLASIREKNPVYGLVFLWVIHAINVNAQDLGYDKIESMSTTITYAHAASMALQLAYLACKRIRQ
jgi:flagellar biosynthesis component FlhA